MLLEGRVALVTGASTGIGKAAAVALAQEGARVGLFARRLDRLMETIAEIQTVGGEAFALQGDVSIPQDVKAAVDQLAQKTGRLDIVFANAGINGVFAPVEDLEPKEWDETHVVNLNGTRMFSNHGFSAYAASKAGQVAFAKMIAAELARYRIRVNVICPGAILSEIGTNTHGKNLEKVRKRIKYLDGAIPLTGGMPGKAEQVADLVVFLASDKSSHITGTEIWIDGGESLIEG